MCVFRSTAVQNEPSIEGQKNVFYGKARAPYVHTSAMRMMIARLSASSCVASVVGALVSLDGGGFLTPAASLAMLALALHQALWMAVSYVRVFGVNHVPDTFYTLFLLSLTLVIALPLLPWALAHRCWRAAVVCLFAAAAVRYIAYGVEFGALDYDATVCDAHIETFVMTSPRKMRDSGRLISALDRLNRVGVPDPSALYGLGQHTAAVDMILSHVHYWHWLHANHTSGWVMMVEDDIWPLSGRAFGENVLRAACQASWADVIWLDTRAASQYTFFGTVGVGTVAVLYRREALLKIASVMNKGTPVYDELEAKGGRALLIDYLLFAVCNRGLLKCAAYPLAAEIGDFSTWT